MTREDAIKIFNTVLLFGKCDCPKEEIEECLKMAIKALEQEPTTKNDLGVDCISRETVKELISAQRLDTFDDEGREWANIKIEAILKGVEELPSVTPQEPKTGHWKEEFNDLEGEVRFTCSSCGKYQLFGTDFCYHCGSDNREVEE